jgi:transcription elongation factor S-II
MTVDILRKTKVGMSVNTLKKKYISQKNINDLAKDLVESWKKVYVASQATAIPAPVPSPAPVPASAPVLVAPVAPAPAPVATASAAAAAAKPLLPAAKKDLSHMFSGLSDARKNVVRLFADCLSDAAILEESAISVARIIETSIDNIHSFASDRKGYTNKAKNLVFNLQNNKGMCAGIASGDVDPESLVSMTNEELTSEEKRIEAVTAQKEHLMSRDLDWAKKNRDQIMRANGLDPNAEGEFVCRKCKGTKTTHYALQTRSSDEPMTIFVTCLTCNSHWRS